MNLHLERGLLVSDPVRKELMEDGRDLCVLYFVVCLFVC